MLPKHKKTAEELDKEVLAIIHTLRPYEEIKIKADEFGRPGKVIILTNGVTILDYEVGEVSPDRRKS